jgi:hypothetical protein
MFKFTIRELLLLTVIAALAVGWALVRHRLQTAAKEGRNPNDQIPMTNAGRIRSQSQVHSPQAGAKRQRGGDEAEPAEPRVIAFPGRSLRVS